MTEAIHSIIDSHLKYTIKWLLLTRNRNEVMFSVKMGDESHHSMAFGCGTSLTIQPQPWLDRNDIAVVGLTMSVQLS